jgi:hypothetical protein
MSIQEVEDTSENCLWTKRTLFPVVNVAMIIATFYGIILTLNGTMPLNDPEEGQYCSRARVPLRSYLDLPIYAVFRHFQRK